MEFYKYLSVWIFCNITYGSNAISIKCGSSNLCFCINHLYMIEFQCPNEKNWNVNIQVGTVRNKVEIQCRGKILNWLDEDLPLLNVDSKEYFEFSRCTLPRNFAEVMSRLQVNNTKKLKFSDSTDSSEITLTRDYFRGLHGLETLTLNYINIRNISVDAFQSLDELNELYLEYNKIQLRDGVFNDLTKLTLLNIADNELSYLPSKIFENLTELTHLYLSINNFSTFNRDTFKNLKKLKVLDLRDIRLENLPENIFAYIKNLKQIDLSINRLQIIPNDLFRNNKLLEVVRIFRNPHITVLPSNLFSNLRNLKEIMLNECNLRKLPKELFEGLINLHHLYLQSNQIENIPTNIFKDLVKLEELDLSYNKIRDLSNEVFSSLSGLKFLNLQNNSLTIIRTQHFHNLPNLEILNLRKNKIQSIDATSFQRVTKLKEIILSRNNITTFGNFTACTKLSRLDLSYNSISSLKFSEVLMTASAVNINLQNNTIHRVNFTDAEVVAASTGNRHLILDGNPIKCNCHMYNLLRYMNRRTTAPVIIEADDLHCLSLNKSRRIPISEVKPNMLICTLSELGIEGNFTDKCLYTFRPWDKSLIIHCTNSNLTEVPELILPTQHFFNHTEVYLEGNLLTSGPRKNMGYDNATKLYLSSNYINEITWLPPRLKVLELHNNNMSYLNHEILNSSSLTNITLGQNPWSCNCTTVDLKLFLRTKLSRNQLDVDTITCRDSEKLLVSLNSDDICQTNTPLALKLGIAVTLFAILLVILIILYYRYQKEIKGWLFAHNILLWLVIENEDDDAKIYDAFISYSHKDEDFVANKLLLGLEQYRRPSYNFCLRVNKWTPGELIIKQITTSVTESRRTIIILSRNFLDSEWEKMEFRTAHIQAIHEGARVILVLYGDIDIETDLDDELKAYVRTNTYLKWGDRWFWNRIRYALPHYPLKPKNILEKPANVTTELSEKCGI